MTDKRIDERDQASRAIASILEIGIYTVAVIIISLLYERTYRADVISGQTGAMQVTALIFFVLLLMSIFSLILYSRTPFVAVLLSLPRLFGKTRSESKVEAAHIPPFVDRDSYPETKDTTVRPGAEKELRSFIDRSEKILASAKNRPSALIFAGFSIAIGGLVFFVFTLPSLGTVTSINAGSVPHQVWFTALEVVPRLLMLIFIQVLAGFFLRQYRSSMEDFRYFETVLRLREAQLISYMILCDARDKKATLKFVEDIMRVDSVGFLSKGQSTAALEALKHEANEMSETASRLMSAVEKMNTSTKSRTSRTAAANGS